MPELPEVETVCRGLAARLEGRTLVRVEQRRPDLRIPFPPRFAARLTGRRVERIGRRGKYILAFLEGGLVLIAHLGMSGRLTLSEAPAPAPGAHDHVILETDDGTIVTFRDHRRFGLMTLCDEAQLESHPLIAGLGPEPLGNEFNGPALSRALDGRRTSIKAALLDQRVVAGLGNIYVCEALYRARVSPRRLARSVPGARAERLARAVREVLADAIAAGGSSISDYVQADGELGYFQHHFAVYGRNGERCPGCDCSGAVRRLVQGGRSTFYCPARQR
ncbi:MAG: bifunctional DNA-formamidopyrimidine glycosylase/DNA-(apurinic or apyrimidinic site) lyase [Alphaproteobacteria bacterium]